MKRMTTRHVVLIALFCVLAVSLIPPVQALEPAWTFTINDSTISTTSVSSDGSTIIVAADSLWIFSKDGTLVKKEKYGDRVVLSPYGRYAVSSFGGTVYFFSTPLSTGPPDPAKMTRMWDYEFSEPVRSIDMTDSGSTVAVATQGMGIFFINTGTQAISSGVEFYNEILRMSHEGGRIVGVTANTVRLYSGNGKVSRSFVMKNITSSNPDFVLLSQTIPLMVINDGPTIRSYDLSRGTEIWHQRPEGILKSLAMTPSGSFVVAGTENGDIMRYDDSGNLNWSYSSYSSTSENSRVVGLTEVVISKDGGLVAAASNEGNILLLNERGIPLGSSHVNARIRDITLSQDGSTLLATSDRNIYAFYTGYTPSSRSSSSVLKTPTPATLNTSGQNITSPQNLTRRPVIPTWTRVSVTPGTITELPTEYSIIRTPAKSPLGLCSGILALLAGIILYYRRRH